ncbi:MAG: RNA-binding protein, partial [Candidatus Bathyarchaeia archaeon]
KGFGFVEFADEKMAEKAMKEMNEKDIEGRKLVVNVARPARDRN